MSSIGVVIGSYQHCKFLGECIESVRAQTLEPDRIVVVDDGSNDGSQKVARSFGRGVSVIDVNRMGPSVLFNRGVEEVGTDLVAIISGDDRMLPNRLAIQVTQLSRTAAELALGLPIVIDENGEQRSDNLAPSFFSDSTNTDSPLTARLFFEGNFLCAPTATFHRSKFLSLGGFHPGLLQLQDFQLWCRWSPSGTTLVSTDRLIEYRKTDQNLSSIRNINRAHAEKLWIYRRFFDSISRDQMSELFDVERFGDGVTAELVQAMLYLQHDDRMIRSIACERILDVLASDGGVEDLDAVGITMQDVFSLVDNYSPTKIFDDMRFVRENIAMRKQFFI